LKATAEVVRPATVEELMGKDKHPIYGRPGHLIRRLQQIAVAIFASEAKDFNITPVQYSALVAVEMYPGIDQTTLVTTIAFDRSTIGSVVSRLEDKEWIKRVPGERRSKRLTITAEGRKVLREIDATVDRAQKLILAPLTSAERPVFIDMLERLVKLNNSRSRAPLGATADERRPTRARRKN
jgi:MarR family transcriptional regulator, lower aerobic nicotinate degradation pathway regulator